MPSTSDISPEFSRQKSKWSARREPAELARELNRPHKSISPMGGASRPAGGPQGRRRATGCAVSREETGPAAAGEQAAAAGSATFLSSGRLIRTRDRRDPTGFEVMSAHQSLFRCDDGARARRVGVRLSCVSVSPRRLPRHRGHGVAESRSEPSTRAHAKTMWRGVQAALIGRRREAGRESIAD